MHTSLIPKILMRLLGVYLWAFACILWPYFRVPWERAVCLYAVALWARRWRPARAGVRRLHVDRRDRGRPVLGHLEVRRVRARRAPVAAAAVDPERDVHGGRGGCDEASTKRLNIAHDVLNLTTI